MSNSDLTKAGKSGVSHENVYYDTLFVWAIIIMVTVALVEVGSREYARTVTAVEAAAEHSAQPPRLDDRRGTRRTRAPGRRADGQVLIGED